MRIAHLLVASFLLANGVFALAPVAQAKPYCTYSESNCDGLVCLWRPVEECVGDRCWFTCWGPQSAGSEADLRGADCADIYNRWSVGPVTVTQRSSCEYDVTVFGKGILLA